MKMKTVLVLAFAVGSGLIAMMGVQQMLSRQGNLDQNKTINVLVAKVDIAPGVLLSETNAEFRELPVQGIPNDAVREKSEYNDRGLRVPVMAGDIIRMTKLGARGEIAASASIPPGMRTVSIQVNDTKTHSGLLQPGDRVDLQVTYEVRSPDGFRQTKTAIFLEYIEVFAADSFRNMEGGESKEIKAKNITLLVTPKQANYIALANTKGNLAPIMRSKTDTQLTYPEGLDETVLVELETGMAYDSAAQKAQKLVAEQSEVKPREATPSQSLKDFLDQGIARKQPEPAPELPPQGWTITIYAGDDVITQEVALTNGGDAGNRNPRTTTTILKPSPGPRGTKPTPAPGERPESRPDANTDKQEKPVTHSLQELLNKLMSGKPLVEPVDEEPVDDQDDEEPNAGRFPERELLPSI